MKSLLAFSVALALVASSFAAEQTYDSGFEQKLPTPFPAAYKDYQILPGSMSPDQRYAFLYPKRSLLYTLPKCGPFVAALEPFTVLSGIPIGHSNLAANAHGYYAANWAKNSSTVVFVAGTKWGPEIVWLLSLREGKVAKRIDLTAAVRQQVLPDFKKSDAAPYNESYDFIFDSQDGQTVIDGETLAERGWDLDDRGHVMIDCTCTTDPKELDPRGWTVRFKGTWDIATGQFVEKAFTRIPPRPRQAVPAPR